MNQAPPLILATVTGQDAPGITAALTGTLAQHDIQIIDIAQSVISGQLTLSLLFKVSPVEIHETLAELLHTAQRLGLKLQTSPMHAHESPRSRARHTYAVTLLAEKISPRALHRVADFLGKNQTNLESIRRLSDDNFSCVELTISSPSELDRHRLKRDLLLIAREMEMDVALQEESLFRRAKRLVVMDMDSTLITAEVIDELARDYGVYDQVAEITREAMKGKIPFQESLRRRCALLKGMRRAQLKNVYARIDLTPGAEDLVCALKKLGFKVALISGGFDFVADELKNRLGLDYVFANRLEFAGDTLTGDVIPPIVDAERKAEILTQIAAQEKIDLSQTVAIGDGANDLLMLDRAGLGIAFHAKPIVSESADLSFNQRNMGSILHLLGLTSRDIQSILPSAN